MEPTRDLNAQKVNNPTEHVMTAEEFTEKYKNADFVLRAKELAQYDGTKFFKTLRNVVKKLNESSDD